MADSAIEAAAAAAQAAYQRNGDTGSHRRDPDEPAPNSPEDLGYRTAPPAADASPAALAKVVVRLQQDLSAARAAKAAAERAHLAMARTAQALLREFGVTGHCSTCKAPIVWVQYAGAKGKRGNHPFDPTGTSHFATCPDAAQHRRAARGKEGSDAT